MPNLETRGVGIEGRGLGLVIVTIAFSLASLTAVILRFVCRHGRYGKDDWTIAFSVAFYISQTFYKLSINPTKLSFLFLYLRIFPPTRENRHFRIATCAVGTYILLYAVASVVATIFQCTPVGRYFDRSSVEGTCIDVEIFWYANAINNIVGDVLTLSLPVRKFWRIRLRKVEK
ncbi:MAG: hypothetical protein Q9216_005278, partial [Gyalolechia sp. 2 TL-2023]